MLIEDYLLPPLLLPLELLPPPLLLPVGGDDVCGGVVVGFGGAFWVGLVGTFCVGEVVDVGGVGFVTGGVGAVVVGCVAVAVVGVAVVVGVTVGVGWAKLTVVGLYVV